MTNIRQEISVLNILGTLPPEKGTDPELIRKYEEILLHISQPITDEEAHVLVKLFGADGCFGLASTLMHLIETSPGWPLKDCLNNSNNEWVTELKNRAIRAGLLSGADYNPQ